jgi:IS5 family transposase
MKRGSSGYEQCYNVQIAVDEAERIIVATGVTQSASDVQQLVPLLEQVEATTGVRPDCALADAGYRSEPNLQHLERQQIEGFVALGRENDESRPESDLEATCRMAEKIKAPRGRRQYAKRKYLAEPPFGWIKWVIGFNRFHLRGLMKVSGEWDLACLAANLRRMHGKLAWA